MESVLARPSVQRVRDALVRAGVAAEIRQLDDTARTAREAADALGLAVGQIASSIIFRRPDGYPLLVLTSGRHRVDTEMVATSLGVPALLRADAEYVKEWSGFSIGGVSPVGWSSESSPVTSEFGYPRGVVVLIDEALADYDEIWAAAGHPHAVIPTTFDELRRCCGASPVRVALD